MDSHIEVFRFIVQRNFVRSQHATYCAEQTSGSTCANAQLEIVSVCGASADISVDLATVANIDAAYISQ